MAQVFFIGATGHIGGAAVNALLTQHPDVRITALVRDQGKGERLKQAFPSVRAVVGDLTDVGLIESESNVAGIVINTSPDYLDGSPAAIKAVLGGLASRPERGFYVQTSGAFLVGEDVQGERSLEKVWDDVADIERITAMPPGRYHQAADQLVRHGASNVNVALVSPTVVYGRSVSTENQVPITIRDIVATARELSAGFTINRGANFLPYVHVDDLADIYARLFAHATKEAASDARIWGPHAYYFATSEELSFAKYMEAIVKVLKEKEVIPTDTIKRIGPESQDSDREIVNKTAQIHGYGTNLRVRSSRAETLLGWKSKQPSVKETLPEIIDLILSRAQL
ncbi:hypothetical protein B0T10DRAFT_524624 [Thelonectria olida]|uniref:NAD(P)-binding domain-containing protein n=1 Tax=Thelonectria olida TaxID=1576542 RepID=A0A9P8VQE4_9HYPO|nr:hypothetical protein B0T10DRAFT_524624 [Thelonectria olida]